MNDVIDLGKLREVQKIQQKAQHDADRDATAQAWDRDMKRTFKGIMTRSERLKFLGVK